MTTIPVSISISSTVLAGIKIKILTHSIIKYCSKNCSYGSTNSTINIITAIATINTTTTIIVIVISCTISTTTSSIKHFVLTAISTTGISIATIPKSTLKTCH